MVQQRANTPRTTHTYRTAAVVVALGEFLDGYDLLIVGSVVLFLKRTFPGLTPSSLGLVTATSFYGAAVGCLLAGDLADRFGRRMVYVFNLLFFVVFAVLSAFATNIPELIVARFFVGLGVGADLPTSVSYLAEISPPAARGRLMGSLPNAMWLVGALVSTLVAILLIPVGASAWRWMFGLAAVPAAIILTVRQFLPESPRWLINHGHPDQAREVCSAFNIDLPETAYEASANRGLGAYKQLFDRKTILTTLIVSGVFFFNCLGTSSSTVAVPYIVHFTGLSVRGSLAFSALIFVCDLVGLAAGALLIDRIRRRTLGLMSAGGTAACTLLIALFGESSHVLILVLFVLLALFAWSGITVLVWVWGSELFPTRIRARGQGVSNATCRIATGSAVFAVPPLLAATGFSVTIALYAAPLAVLFVIIASARRLDTTGRTLETLSA